MLTIARPTVVLPHPDSPTSPSVSPWCSWNEMPFTASTSPTRRSNTPPKTGNLTTRFWMSSRTSLVIRLTRQRVVYRMCHGRALGSPRRIRLLSDRGLSAVRVEMAPHPMAARVFNQWRFDVRARFERVRTPGDELAADRQAVDVGNGAGNDGESARFGAVDARDRAEQAVGVGMERRGEERVDRGDFLNLSPVHDGDAIAGF